MLELAYCGDDCNICPRYIATQADDEKKLKEVTAMWHRAGWRDTVVPPEQMLCHGCATVKCCRYDRIRECAKEKGITNCGRCSDYPCSEIEMVFEQTQQYAKQARQRCSKEDYECFQKAFFSKKQNLDRVHQEYFSHE